MWVNEREDGIELGSDECVTVESTATMNVQLESIPHDGLVISVWDPNASSFGGGFIRQGCVDPQGTLRLEGYLDHTEEVTRLQNLVNDFEAANIRRQGEIESLRKELEAVHKSYQEKLNAKKLHMTAMSTELQELRQSKRKDKIVDYSLVDPDLLRDYAVAVLNSYADSSASHEGEVSRFEEEIEEQATFHPHVQQQIVKDEQGRNRFRKNLLVDRLVDESGGHGLTGLNYIATLEASREDRAQLAQLIGYSVDGYQSLDYALPVEDQK